jgi:hypothetical protein
MDPNAALERIRGLVNRMLDDEENPDGQELAELFEGLDQWISSGGFIPTDWLK